MSAPARYARVQIALHWAVVLLFGFNYVVSDGMGRALRTKLEGGAPAEFAALIHPQIGFALLVVMVLRVIARLALKAPAPVDTGKPLMDKAAHWTHLALYVLLFAIPLSGIAAWQFGVHEAGDVHELAVNLAVFLVVVHTAAALFHQFVLKDGLLLRMKPGR